MVFVLVEHQNNFFIHHQKFQCLRGQKSGVYKLPRAVVPEARNNTLLQYLLCHPILKHSISKTKCLCYWYVSLLFRQFFLKITSLVFPSSPHTATKNKKFLLSLKFDGLLSPDLLSFHLASVVSSTGRWPYIYRLMDHFLLGFLLPCICLCRVLAFTSCSPPQPSAFRNFPPPPSAGDGGQGLPCT